METSIDILLAVYNGESFIEDQIASIFAQNYKNFRLIIRDNHSNDRTLKIIEKFKSAFPEQIVILHSPINLGCIAGLAHQKFPDNSTFFRNSVDL